MLLKLESRFSYTNQPDYNKLAKVERYLITVYGLVVGKHLVFFLGVTLIYNHLCLIIKIKKKNKTKNPMIYKQLSFANLRLTKHEVLVSVFEDQLKSIGDDSICREFMTEPNIDLTSCLWQEETLCYFEQIKDLCSLVNSVLVSIPSCHLIPFVLIDM